MIYMNLLPCLFSLFSLRLWKRWRFVYQKKQSHWKLRIGHIVFIFCKYKHFIISRLALCLVGVFFAWCCHIDTNKHTTHTRAVRQSSGWTVFVWMVSYQVLPFTEYESVCVYCVSSVSRTCFFPAGLSFVQSMHHIFLSQDKMKMELRSSDILLFPPGFSHTHTSSCGHAE